MLSAVSNYTLKLDNKIKSQDFLIDFIRLAHFITY